MALGLIAYPKIIYTQSAEPSDKTIGRLWYDTDDGKLYSADGTNYNLIGGAKFLKGANNDVLNLTPTETGGGTFFTNLINITDENSATYSFGQVTTGNVCYLNFDLGTNKERFGVFAHFLHGIYTDNEIKLQYSPDNSAWTTLTNYTIGGVESETKKLFEIWDIPLTFRYLRFV